MPTPTPSRLEMRNISIAFAGFNALQNVDFTLQGGSTHALVGANGAGKSTLMAILSGAHDHYRGEIFIDGQQVDIHSPLQARQYGIHVVQQEVDVALIPTLSVAENIMLDWLNEPGHLLNWAQLYRQAAQLLTQLDLTINLRQRLSECTLAEKQQVLLARALSHRCRFLVLDEPTAPLDRAESERLFRVVRRLQSEGIGVVFISHRIHELSEICDRLTVLRDGRHVSEDAMQGLSGEQIVEKMLGHRLDDISRPHAHRTVLARCYGWKACTIAISCATSACNCIRGKFLASPGWPAREKPNCARRYLAPHRRELNGVNCWGNPGPPRSTS